MNMVIKRAQKEDADIIGEVHSAAWKQTYQGVFSQEYLDSDSPSARREEFLSSLNDRHCVYLLLKDDDQTAGIVKLASFYKKCGFELTDKTRLIDRGGSFKQLMYVRNAAS